MKSTVIPSGRICSFPRVCIRLQREGEGRERMEEKKHEREREREREKDRNTKGRRDGAGRASRKFFIL